jgi:hypothetical protein
LYIRRREEALDLWDFVWNFDSTWEEIHYKYIFQWIKDGSILETIWWRNIMNNITNI